MYTEPLLPYYLTELVAYGMAAGAGYLAWRVVRAYEHRTAEPARLTTLNQRVQLLEEAVERTEGLLLQTVETQQFTTRLLLSRREDEQRSSGGQRSQDSAPRAGHLTCVAADRTWGASL